MNWKVQLCELNFDKREHDAVEEVLRSEWLTMGGQVENFEINFSKYLGLKDQGVAVSSATAGLHLILMALDIRENDEVIIPGLTFCIGCQCY